jgi:hypothetical protein
MRVAILGCGPAGLLAAHAAMMSGVSSTDITIYSKKQKSILHGAQYMGAEIEGLPMRESRTIKYHLIGTREQYATKVYGAGWDGQVSPDDFEGEHQAWDIRDMYELLWKAWEDRIAWAEVTPAWMAGDLPADYDRVFSTIPKPSICFQKHHQFRSQMIYAIGGPTKDPAICEPDSIICDGTDMYEFYRVSNIFGHQTIEWPPDAHDLPVGVVSVRKPLINDCDCWDRHAIIGIGRYGSWTKGVLVHDAYQAVRDAL